MKQIPFNVPYMTGNELSHIAQAHANGRLAGDGPFTKGCHQWLEKNIGTPKALLTHSCTSALEMAALLIDIKPGDEIIMPSYTFVSTANAFVLRGGIPVFIDIREDTLNLDEKLIAAAITPRTRAIVPVHYAGVGCEMDYIMDIADQFKLKVIEDSAQGVMASYKNKPLGGIGDLGAISFHETKNIICGEGGALLVNDANFIPQAEIIREKGTDRSKFFRGEVDKYTWQEIGSSFLPGEVTAAFLTAQFNDAVNITQARIKAWNNYHKLLEDLEKMGRIRRPIIPSYCQHNAHMYYILLQSGSDRKFVLDHFKEKGISPVSHYVPLHSSPAGVRLGRIGSDMKITDAHSECIIRLPLWIGINNNQQEQIVDILKNIT